MLNFSGDAALQTSIEVDIATEYYPVEARELLHVVLLKSLVLNQTLADAFDHDPRSLGRSISDEFGYVMHGVCYQKDEGKEGQVL